MGRKRRQQSEPEGIAGAPEWMVTFSDCMTLLLTFFVLLLSFSSFSDEDSFNRLKQILSKEFSVGSKDVKKDAVSSVEPIRYDDILNAGSEKPTSATGIGDHLKEETEPVNFRNRKVFLISSDRIFWGNGWSISSQGEKTLTTMASFLSEVPNRIVISEGPQSGAKGSEDAGLHRSWAVMDYLITKRELDKQKFSISATVTTAEVDSRQSRATGQRNPSTTRTGRTLEIVLLERSIYN